MRSIVRLLFLWFLPAQLCLGQARVLQGKVTDQHQTPIEGAIVWSTSHRVQTATDSTGVFRLALPQADSQKVVLRIDFVGKKTLLISEDQDLQQIVLQDDSTALDETIAIGYGNQHKLENTGAIASIKGSDIAHLPITSYEQALQGRLPGVQITSAGGEIGAAMTVRVRGAASVTAGNQPLIVLDGFVLTTESVSNFKENNAYNPMADLNPNDIQSIEVLKDAAAAAIYGARGSNGVILITTKRGVAGKTVFQADYSTGISLPTHLRSFLNRDQYVTMFTDAARNAGVDVSSTSALDAAWAENVGGGQFSQLVAEGANSNWNKESYRTARFSQYGLSATGGSEKTRFLASFSYLDQQGIIVRNDLKRLSGRFNFDHEVSKRVNIGLNIHQVYSLRHNIPENNQLHSPLEATALAPLYNIRDPATHEYNGNTNYGNPFFALANSQDRTTGLRNFSNGYLSIHLLPTLVWRSEIGMDLLHHYDYKWKGSKFPTSAGIPSSGQYGTALVLNYSTNNTLTWDLAWNTHHHLQALVGHSFQHAKTEMSGMQGQGLPTDNFRYLANASESTSFSSSATAFKYNAVFARLHYHYRHKYLLSASIRRDASSRFGANRQHGWFPAISAGYVLSEEAFFKRTPLFPIVHLLKLRTSIGSTGNSEVGNNASYGLYNSTFWGSQGGIFPSQLSNPNLTWERTTQWDIGLEFGMFRNRISGGVDYYQKNTQQLLLALPIPATSGYIDPAGLNSTLRNTGSMHNKGWELYITTYNIDRKVKWSTTFTISQYKNTVDDLRGQIIYPAGNNFNAAVEGQPIGVFYGIEYAGVDPANGNALYYLANGDTTSNINKADQSENYKALGSPHPKHYGGIGNKVEYRGFDFFLFGQWSYGNKVYNGAGVFQNGGFEYSDNQTEDMMDYWKQPGQITNVPRPVLGQNNGAIASSRFLSDASYFRIKTVTLGYTLPKPLIQKIRFTEIRIYLTGQNLFTITPYKGNDPEVNYVAPGSATQHTNLSNGIDYYSPPQAKTYLIGINATF